jgi:histidyl-tRNA synthetase
MSKTPPLPKGTRDFYPQDQRVQNHIFGVWRKAALRFGYEEYEGPLFEHLELYTGKSGEEIVKQLYNFTDKGGREIALRPEMTPTLARLVIQKGSELKKPFKWFSIPRLFRYERAQKGRLREFFQLNLDIIGTESVYAEADLLCAICAMLQDFGLSQSDFVIGVSNRALLSAFLDELGVANKDPVYPLLDRRLKMPEEQFAQELEKAGLSAELTNKLNNFMNSKTLEEVKNQVSSEEGAAAILCMETLFGALAAAGVSECVALDLSVVRGLAYYTGIVFEVFDRNKNMRAIAGGGRYDSLTATLGGQKTPGVGFGMGDVVLADLLREKGLLPTVRGDLDVYLASFAGNMDALFACAAKFRALGLNCAHSLAPAKLGKQLEAANAAGAKLVVFVDGTGAGEGEYEYKVLESGESGAAGAEKIVAMVSAASAGNG